MAETVETSLLENWQIAQCRGTCSPFKISCGHITGC